jgi:hypothetical protein
MRAMTTFVSEQWMRASRTRRRSRACRTSRPRRSRLLAAFERTRMLGAACAFAVEDRGRGQCESDAASARRRSGASRELTPQRCPMRPPRRARSEVRPHCEGNFPGCPRAVRICSCDSLQPPTTSVLHARRPLNVKISSSPWAESRRSRSSDLAGMRLGCYAGHPCRCFVPVSVPLVPPLASVSR